MNAQTPAPAPAQARRIPPKVKIGELFEIAGNHVSTWGLITDAEWRDIFEPNYFLPIAHWFRRKNLRGPQMDWRPDEIKVYRPIRPSTDTLYYEMCTVMVTFADPNRVTVQPLYSPFVVGAPEGTMASWPPAEVAPPPPPVVDPAQEGAKRPARQAAAAA